MPKPTYDHDQRVLLLLATMQDQAVIKQACIDKLGMTPAKAAAEIRKARKALTIAARVHHDDEVGRAVIRLNDLYERSLRVQDVKTALAAARELHKLLNLYTGPVTDKQRANSAALDRALGLVPDDEAFA